MYARLMFLTKYTIGLFIMFAIASSPVRAGFQQSEDFEQGEQVESLTVRIDVGANGDDLDEPVALDLGLGFPLWLGPVGRKTGDRIPFGAVPQESDAQESIPAGSSATFTFKLEGEPGQDVFEASSQLLQNVRAADIARVGFSSAGSNGWVLKGYEIKINDRVFVANDDVNLKATDLLGQAQTRIAEINTQAAPLQTELDDLQALVTAELATDADLQQLKTVGEQLLPLLAEKERLSGQLEAKYPWFDETGFVSPWRSDSRITLARVALVTAGHSGAGTQNYVYFRTGGRKFLLGSPDTPLSSQAGPQLFDLDLTAGPMTTADLRGFAVGMLGHPEPYADAPDRWHPQRILVAVDGRIIYDSEENPIDRKSLEAIRLVPPIHVDDQSQIATNNLSAREFHVWVAGQAEGLDLSTGGTLPLPSPDDPNYPEPEPLDTSNIGGGGGGGGADSGLLPGEGSGAWPSVGGGSGGGGVWPGGGGWPNNPNRPGIRAILDILGILGVPGGGGVWPGGGGGNQPQPQGDPPQTKNVRIVSGWRDDLPFKVEWDFSGNENDVADYVVELLEFHPEAAFFPVGPNVLSAPKTAAVGSRDASLNLLGPLPGGIYFVIPRVTVRPIDPNVGNFTAFGPVRPVFPAHANKATDRVVLFDKFQYKLPLTPPQPMPFGEQPSPNRAVWTFGRAPTHIGFEMDGPGDGPAHNVAVRLDKNDELIRLAFFRFFTGKVRLTAHLGLSMGENISSDAKVTTDYMIVPMAPVQPGNPQPVVPIQSAVPPVVLANQPGQPLDPMKVIDHVIDFQGIETWHWAVFYTVTIKGGISDPDHPPALFGVRVIPEK